MTPELEALARRAVACPRWRWMPGMVTVEVLQPAPWSLPVWDEAVVIPCAGDDAQVCTLHGRVRDLHVGALPDLTSPATLGCLLALVREAWGDPYLIAAKERGAGWIIDENQCNSMLVGGRYIRGATEIEALIAALEAAP